MESSAARPTAADATAALHEAEASLDRLARGMVMPSWFFTAMAVAIATQIATTAAVFRGGDRAGLVLALGLTFFAAVAGAQLLRFRRRNGVWIGGLASRVVLGTGTVASVSYAVALTAAGWASLEGQWALVALCSISGGAAYALGGRRWLRTYRAQPAVHGRAESALWVSALSVPALAGLALLAASA